MNRLKKWATTISAVTMLATGFTLAIPTQEASASATFFDGKQNSKNPKISVNETATSTYVRTLRLTSPYMRGDDVEFAQGFLRIQIDGIYGPTTVSKVKSFQSSHGLTADGIVGSSTWKALLQSNGLRTLRLTSPYMIGEDVKEVQRILHLTVDGVYGPNTAQAVKNVQSQNGMTADGVVGTNTWYLLYLIWKYD